MRQWVLKVSIVLILLVVSFSLGAATQFPTDHLAIVGADGRRHEYAVEVASTPEQLTQGLMFRRQMAANAGMIFDFQLSKPVSMWMKNTLIPLDMVFVDQRGIITGIAERAVPQSLDIISSPGPARAVIELNGGAAQAAGIKAGDRVVFALFN